MTDFDEYFTSTFLEYSLTLKGLYEEADALAVWLRGSDYKQDDVILEQWRLTQHSITKVVALRCILTRRYKEWILKRRPSPPSTVMSS